MLVFMIKVVHTTPGALTFDSCLKYHVYTEIMSFQTNEPVHVLQHALA